MERFVLIALLVAATGCSSDPDDDALENAVDNSATVNASANNGTVTRPDLVESPDCFAEPARLNARGAEITYITATEEGLKEARREYGAWCVGGVNPVDIDWEALLASRGFDDGELDEPGAVTAAAIPLLNGAQIFCEGSSEGTLYRAKVQRVVLTATDTMDRVGLCYDETSSVLVSRFMLTPDATTSTQLDEAEVTAWLVDNLE